MQNRELNRQLSRLRWLISQTQTASDDQLELQAHWGRYLCVLVAGFIENAYGELYSSFVRNAASEPVTNYTTSVLLRVQNPKSSRFIETARAFRPEWAQKLENFLAEEGRKDALDAIMANRHLIAHGQDAGVTVARVQSYLDKCVKVFEYIETLCGLIRQRGQR